MLLVAELESGVHELLYMWLPTWIGMNVTLKQEIESHIKKQFVGREATLHDIHEAVIDFLVNRFPEIQGLREYLSAVEQVKGPDEEPSREEG
jgi:hypothetical protein